VYIDHPEGVDHALCERVTRELDDYRRKYAIDVSSPGIERPLRKPAHFERFVGHRVALRTAREIAGRKRFKGQVIGADEQAVHLATEPQPVDIPYDEIVRGNLIDEGSKRAEKSSSSSRNSNETRESSPTRWSKRWKTRCSPRTRRRPARRATLWSS